MSKVWKESKGVKASTLNTMLIVSVVIVGLSMFISSFLLTKKYETYLAEEESYMECVKQADIVELSSNTLTVHCMHFVCNRNPQTLRDYFAEIETGHKEKAIRAIADTIGNTKIIEDAKVKSDELEELEIHAMKLVCEADGLETKEISERLTNYSLNEEEKNLSAKEKREKAVELIMGDEYQSYKENIQNGVANYLQNILNEKTEIAKKAQKRVEYHIYGQIYLVLALIVFIVLVVIIYNAQITSVVREYAQCILEHKPLKKGGVYELQYLAEVYNANAKKAKQQAKILKKQANQDSLTGALNRRSFKNIMEEDINAGRGKGIFMILDIDNFKTINDTYGHETGDRVLVQVIHILKNWFRKEDIICRFGGDEFAIWIRTATVQDRHFFQKRMEEINASLQNDLAKDIPSFSLSIGCSFVDSCDSFLEVYKRADKALYSVKNAGRCGCQFYENLKVK